MSSLLEDPPLPARPRTLQQYVLPALVLINLLLALSLLGVLPPLFGDHPDPARVTRQIDADRVRILPAGTRHGSERRQAPSSRSEAAPAAPAATQTAQAGGEAGRQASENAAPAARQTTPRRNPSQAGALQANAAP